MVQIELAGTTYDLKVTMHRLKLLKELSGVDILNPGDGDNNLHSAEHMIAALYAFAGGEATGVTREVFEDSIEMKDLPAVSQAIADVMQTDVGRGEGNDSQAETASK